MYPFGNSSEDSGQDHNDHGNNDNPNSSPRIFHDPEVYSDRGRMNLGVSGRSSPQKRNWRSSRDSGDGIDSIAKMMAGSGRSESPKSGFFDNAGSIGEAISKLIAASKRQAQRVTPLSLDNAIVNEENLSKQEKILKTLSSYAVRKGLSEKAIERWHEIAISFNEFSRNMADSKIWEEYMPNVFNKNTKIIISGQSNGENKCFNLCFPMLCVIWEVLRRCGQESLETKTSRPRAQVLSNGSIIIEDDTCCTGHWKGGSNIERRICTRASLDLNFMVQWLEVRFMDRAADDWYALDEMLRASISNSYMMNKLAQLVELTQMLSGTPQTIPQVLTDGSISSSAASSNETAVEEFHSHMKEFSNLSDTSRHQKARRTFQMTDVMSSLTDLLIYRKEKQIVSPLEALDRYVSNNQTSNSTHLGEMVPANKTAKMENLPYNHGTPSTVGCNSSPENPSTVFLSRQRTPGIRKKPKKKTTALTAASSTSLASLRLTSSRISKDKTGGSNAIPGTKKIRF
ncbi:hypothetical protein ZYGR_0I04470 [Zygosaccharomyces rouxii]|uniref:Uncharacterized protein n=1 Tax=Zygosaccharomyces rouxii TaxID=4956 RepID=A0A1Q2ZXB4_ZYGRO|nr:hypothetical protein ZYGR_0I04470 [Zygosaccharomyces rouxii]